MKPKYLVYRSDKWYDGCDEEESEKWALRDFEREYKDIQSGFQIKSDAEDYYLIFAEVTKCLSFKEIQSSRGSAK